jgi:hypothetical protein
VALPTIRERKGQLNKVGQTHFSGLTLVSPEAVERVCYQLGPSSRC